MIKAGVIDEADNMAVLPKHQKQGVGLMIMEALVNYLQKNAPKTAYVSLMADHGTSNFYAKFGFPFSKFLNDQACI
jgi:GNAT superfamily N-acetyltransferase